MLHDALSSQVTWLHLDPSFSIKQMRLSDINLHPRNSSRLLVEGKEMDQMVTFIFSTIYISLLRRCKPFLDLLSIGPLGQHNP